MNLLKYHLCDVDNSQYYPVWINTWQVSLMKSSSQAIMSIPKGRPYAHFQSDKYKGTLNYGVSYSVREGHAQVSMETYGGEEARDMFEAIIATTPSDNPLKKAEMNQGKRNKNKWSWTYNVKIDKTDKDIVRWYVDSVRAFYNTIEG